MDAEEQTYKRQRQWTGEQEEQERSRGADYRHHRWCPSSPPQSPPSERHRRRHHHHHHGGGSTVVRLSDAALGPALAADGYRMGSTIGRGSYSKVRLAQRSAPRGDGQIARVACKVIDKKRETADLYVRKFLPRELQVLCTVRHPNIVHAHRIYETPSAVHIFMDYCEGGDLLNYMVTKKMPYWQTHTFFEQICGAVDYLHRNDISHRDIKCENVLLESMRHVKLTDFGFARQCGIDERGRRVMSQTYCGSSSYAAPEVLQGIPHDPKPCDVWALGVLLYVMLTDVMPYPYSSRNQIVINQMTKRLAKPKKSLSQESLKLIEIILEPDITKRATISHIRSHSWFKQNPHYAHSLTTGTTNSL